MTFKALLAAKTDEIISTSVVEMNEQDLMPGDVMVAVDYSTVNYNDAIALSGRGEIIRQFPLIPGIDLAGTVEALSYPGIARDLDLRKLARTTQVVGLTEVPDVVRRMFAGKVQGRTVVDVNA